MGGRSVAGMLKLEKSVISVVARRFRSRVVVELESLALGHRVEAVGIAEVITAIVVG